MTAPKAKARVSGVVRTSVKKPKMAIRYAELVGMPKRDSTHVPKRYPVESLDPRMLSLSEAELTLLIERYWAAMRDEIVEEQEIAPASSDPVSLEVAEPDVRLGNSSHSRTTGRDAA